MKIILNYNFKPSDIEDLDFKSLYETKRRDSIFAFVFQIKDTIYAIRDHLGIIPLYYRSDAKKYRFSLGIDDLVKEGDRLDRYGVEAFLTYSTVRNYPLIKGMHIVPPGSVLKIDCKTNQVTLVYNYIIKPKHITLFSSQKQIVDKMEILFIQAIKRQIKEKQIGLYLSGGVDSGLIGQLLTKEGITINAYTSAPWSLESTDVVYAKKNSKKMLIRKHYVDEIKEKDYYRMFHKINKHFPSPHASEAVIGTVHLGEHTPLLQEKQLFMGQNLDTLLCTEFSQYATWILDKVPKLIRNKLSRLSSNYSDIGSNYIMFTSKYILSNPKVIDLIPWFSKLNTKFNNIQKLTILGMLLLPTPRDSEVFIGLAINKGILVSDPYYDIDFIEYCMGIPLIHRLQIDKKNAPYITLGKKIWLKLSERYLPYEDIYRKKNSFSPSIHKDNKLQSILPQKILQISLKDADSKLAGTYLIKWTKKHKIDLPVNL